MTILFYQGDKLSEEVWARWEWNTKQWSKGRPYFSLKKPNVDKILAVRLEGLFWTRNKEGWSFFLWTLGLAFGGFTRPARHHHKNTQEIQPNFVIMSFYKHCNLSCSKIECTAHVCGDNSEHNINFTYKQKFTCRNQYGLNLLEPGWIVFLVVK
jgi:hypothetical protein